MSYAYIHVPFCKSICAYCDFVRCGYNHLLAERWLKVICEEIKQKLEGKELKTLYIGGGTPTALSIPQMEILLSSLQPYIKKVEEFSVEANVESLTKDMLMLLKKYGVNRISLGVQTLQPALIKIIKRHHTQEMVLETIRRIHKCGIHNISCDLIYGLPTQTFMDWQKDLKILCEQDISHVSLYSLTIEEHSEFGRTNVALMDEDLEADLFEYAQQYLQMKGFEHYEISNFAKHGCRSQHNQVYWHYEDFIGIGCGASGKIAHRRYDNTRNLQVYFEHGASPTYIDFDSDEEIFEAIMMGLRMKDGINLEKFKMKYNINICDKYGEIVQKNLQKGLMLLENGSLRVTQEGMMVLNEVLLDFLD